jgi:RND superfamily putative drug exporter
MNMEEESIRTGYTIGLSGPAAESIDASDKTYTLFPTMILVTCGVVFLMLTAAFKSLIIALRSVVTIGVTLVWVYGFSSMVYADGIFNSWGFGGLTGIGEYYWLTPVMSFTIIVGLGVDYDVFLLGRVVEARDAGFNAWDSIVIGAYSTGHIITAAGIIMVRFVRCTHHIRY